MPNELVTVEVGVEILRDLAHKEQYQYTEGIYAGKYALWQKARERYIRAKSSYPIAMMRAQSIFLQDPFCLQCGASVPPREGEGTCYKCDPVGVMLNWVRQRIEIAADNPGLVDDYGYQRDQGKLEILHELEEMLK